MCLFYDQNSQQHANAITKKQNVWLKKNYKNKVFLLH